MIFYLSGTLLLLKIIEHTMKEYFDKVILPYFSQKRKDLKLRDDYPALLIFGFKEAGIVSCFDDIAELFAIA